MSLLPRGLLCRGYASLAVFCNLAGLKLLTFVNNDNCNCNNVDLKICAIIAHL
jgi:hypothetical protein